MSGDNGERSAEERADALGISKEAIALYDACDVVDLHNDLYVPARLYGYNVHRKHRPRLFGAMFTGQSDLPRLREARLSAVYLDIATNPLRRSSRRFAVTLKNIEHITADLAKASDQFELVSTFSGYQKARAAGKTACFIGIQGGQAFQHDTAAMEAIPEVVSRITLVHLTSSQIGVTSSPLGRSKRSLAAHGAQLIEVMNAKRILVDLAHISRPGFIEAARHHDKTQPLICTHTGVNGVRSCWRNIDDEQIRLVTDTGGTIGIIFHSGFLDKCWFRCDPERVVDHMEHVIRIAGEEHVSIGTDYDGMIRPPRGLREVTDLPRLVQIMLDRKWAPERVHRVMGKNALRVIREIRP